MAATMHLVLFVVGFDLFHVISDHAADRSSGIIIVVRFGIVILIVAVVVFFVGGRRWRLVSTREIVF